MKRILVVAAHADDEILGCGGTMAKHVEMGDKVYSMILCSERSKDAKKAAIAIGATNTCFLNYADQRFDRFSLLEITQDIESWIGKVKPDVVFTHWIGDLNKDHEITARATLTACRPLPASTIEAIYGFEIPSSTEWAPLHPFVPNHFESLSHENIDEKSRALRCYESEMREHPHARSYLTVAELLEIRGGQCGVKYAEAFHTYRSIRRI
jgi:LmbE family N-acetylglucosaminyl deacetylase